MLANLDVLIDADLRKQVTAKLGQQDVRMAVEAALREAIAYADRVQASRELPAAEAFELLKSAPLPAYLRSEG